MNKENSWVISLEAPDGGGVGVDHYDVSADWNLGYFLRTIPHRSVCISAIHDLELVAVHVPRMTATVEIIDYYFYTVLGC
jgi:hypothetical protein